MYTNIFISIKVSKKKNIIGLSEEGGGANCHGSCNLLELQNIVHGNLENKIENRQKFRIIFM